MSNGNGNIMLNMGVDSASMKAAIDAFIKSEQGQAILLKLGMDDAEALSKITSIRTKFNKLNGDIEKVTLSMATLNGVTSATFSATKDGFAKTSDMGTLQKNLEVLKKVTYSYGNLAEAEKKYYKQKNDPIGKLDTAGLKKYEEQIESMRTAYSSASANAQMSGSSNGKMVVRKQDIAYQREMESLMTQEANKKLSEFTSLQQEISQRGKQIVDSKSVVSQTPSSNTKERKEYIDALEKSQAALIANSDAKLKDMYVDGQKAASEAELTKAILKTKQATLESQQATQSKTQAKLEALNPRRLELNKNTVAIQDSMAESMKKLRNPDNTPEKLREEQERYANLFAEQWKNDVKIKAHKAKITTASATNEVAIQEVQGTMTETNALKNKIGVLEKESVIQKNTASQAEAAKKKAIDSDKLYQMQVKASNSVNNSFFRDIMSGWKEAAARIVNYTVVYRSLWAGIKLFQSALATIVELNKAFTNIQMVTGYTIEQVRTLKGEYADLAQQMGSTISEVVSGAEQWLRQGRSIAETNELLKQSTIFSKISGMDAQTSTNYLTSTLNGYQLMASEAENVIDVFNYLDVVAATSAEEIAEA